jgi:hypothetical protein
VTEAVPEVVAVKVEVHVVETVVPASWHVVKVPATPVSDSVIVPFGATKVPGEMSVTVTLQVEPWLITTGVVQVTVVDEARGLTTRLPVPLLEP